MHNFALCYFYSIAQTVDYIKVYPLLSKIFRSKEAKSKDFKIHLFFYAQTKDFLSHPEHIYV